MWNKRNSLGLMVVWSTSLWACSSAAPDQGTGQAATQQQGTAAGTTATAPTAGKPATTTASAGSSAAKPAGSAGSGTQTATSTTPAAGAAGKASTGASAAAGGGAAGTSTPATASAAGGGAAGTTAGAAGAAGGGDSASSIVTMPAACPTDGKMMPGDTNGSIMVGGMMRTYILHIPPGYDGKTPMPLVIDWHPLTQNAAYQRMASGYAALGDKEGFVTIFPDGINAAWNIGKCCTMSRDVDDKGLAVALVEMMRKESCVDMKRVYSVGYSMGGGMTHFLGCNEANLFAAISPAAFDLLEEDEEPCHPVRPLTEIQFRGTADPIVPYAGGESTPPTGYPLDPIHFLGAEGTFKKWAMLDGCTGEPEMGMGGCQTYKQCKDGVEVTLCTKQGGGHDTGDADVGWATLKRFSLPN